MEEGKSEGESKRVERIQKVRLPKSKSKSDNTSLQFVPSLETGFQVVTQWSMKDLGRPPQEQEAYVGHHQPGLQSEERDAGLARPKTSGSQP